ncbi:MULTISPECIES: hypothetical protein [Aliarcobacter]|uniref:Membrane protein n=1 Tax=Aliarcobacter skirrowii CCUG 10374 TaxID=1032239 RepID=A0AAD0WN70_9BACT|nr:MULTISPECIES: hypothetical protein [Aliarcobacter]AXX84613.1 putative membrane protein [Aliarcobacter skirrowii CCUG 10374]KAB0619011.1 hypothetical protein F7P70_10020 [Aliarcobacter skirrowii CCUG 10374]RXI24702.1 hypothetical protein CP959_09705 [Aliarcobacter skirrowii CCUG 10374]TLT06627.1 hypothetical protein FE243_06925 [Aliarcobacter thereius]SUV14780.1 Uncharacterised protein [Aliarcobacter skirrowii]
MKIFTFFTLLLLFINSFISYSLSGSFMYMLGNVYAIPLLLMGLFYIFKDSRNKKSMLKVLFFSSIIIFISLIGNILTIIQNIQIK